MTTRVHGEEHTPASLFTSRFILEIVVWMPVTEFSREAVVPVIAAVECREPAKSRYKTAPFDLAPIAIQQTKPYAVSTHRLFEE